MHALPLLGRYVAASLRGQMQYPASAVMLSLGQLAATAVEVVAVWALFHRFGGLKDWALGEVLFFYAMVNIAFSIADFLTRGFDVFGSEFVRTGAFDRLLLRPRSAALQLIGHDFRISRIGRLAQGLGVLAWGTVSLNFDWTAQAVGLAAWTLCGAVALFVALFILQAVVAFWTVESLEVFNALTYGGTYAAQFPMSIYASWMRGFLTYVFPLACVAYYPVLAILGRSDPLGAPDWLLPLTPAAGFAFLAVSLCAWRFGVSKYTSTGS